MQANEASRGMSVREIGNNASPLRSVDVVATYFEYTGSTGLTVQGPITGRRYRFSGPGARVGVDSRDAPSVAGAPNLKRVRNS
ncbi:MAG: hypothetical protein AABN34_23485 [Acidobacteriota bacterium]